MADDTQGLPGDAGQGAGAVADDSQNQQGDSGQQGDNGQGATQGDQQAAGQDGAQAQQPPPAPTAEEIRRQASEEAFQRVASWIGRRDKDLMDNLGNLINSRIPPPQQQPPAPPVDAAAILERPDAAMQQMGYVKASDIPRIINDTIGQQTAAEQRYNAEVVQQTAALMDADPIFQGEEGKKLGAEAIEEIQKGFRTLDKRLPPQIAAQLLLNGAVAGVSRKRILTKPNAFAGKTPVKGPMGTVTPPVATPAKAKAPKLSADAAALAKRWGYSEEDISKVFASEA